MATFGKVTVLEGGRPPEKTPAPGTYDCRVRAITYRELFIDRIITREVDSYVLSPGHTVECLLGFKIELKPEFFAIVRPADDLLKKKFLVEGMIDHAARVECRAFVFNASDDGICFLDANQVIAQLTILPRISGEIGFE